MLSHINAATSELLYYINKNLRGKAKENYNSTFLAFAKKARNMYQLLS